MSVKPPQRWTPRSLTAMFLPHLFRKARNPGESTGVRKEKVPLDANENHLYIKRKESKMARHIRTEFGLNGPRPEGVPKTSMWSIATGEWVPEHQLKLTYVFPFSLGPMVAQEVSRRIYFRNTTNGMLIPTAVGRAFDDWALAIVPHKDCRHQLIPKSLTFRRIEAEAKSLRAPVVRESSLAVQDLDGRPLHFRNNVVLNPYSCYFHSCCAVWKSTFLEQPDRTAEGFWERFQFTMDELWGSQRARQEILNIFKPPELVESGGIDGPGKEVKDALPSVGDEAAVGHTEGEQATVEARNESPA